MKLVSWNVNGLRSCLTKGFLEYVKNEDPDILCLQETKLQPEQAVFDLEGYHRYFHSADKKGYSGTAVLTKEEPPVRHLRLRRGYPPPRGPGHHGGVSGLLSGVLLYPQQSGRAEAAPYRMQWEDDLRAYLLELDGKKPVVYCGDLNVAHQEMDLKNPKTNRQNPGFSDQERAKMTRLLESGFADTFRTPAPGGGHLPWWSYRFHAREKNAGWRIDYFIVSRRLLPRVTDAAIRTEVYGSDHCPVVLQLDTSSGQA